MVARPDFGPMAGPMREALDKYSREELADLLAHIVRIYVVEGQDSGNIDVRRSEASSSLAQLKDLSFSQLILHLQMNLPHAELERLRVSGDRVWAERDGTEVLLCGAAPVEDVPPDWEDLAASGGPPRGSGPPVRTPALRAAVGPMNAAPTTPPVGTPQPTPRSPGVTPSSTAQEAGRVQRPSVGLRDEPEAAPARNSMYDDFFGDSPASPPPPRGPKAAAPKAQPKPADSGEKKDKIGERSDRFSMLELD